MVIGISRDVSVALLSQPPWTEKRTSLQPVPPGPPSIGNGAHAIDKLMLKTQLSEDFAKGSQSENLIFRIPIR